MTEYTEPKLAREFPEAWEDGFQQGLNPKGGTSELPYRNPYAHGTPEDQAWRMGNWRGFCKVTEGA